MELPQAARNLLEPMGYEVLEVTVGRRGRKRRILLRIDRLDESVVTIDDVARASEVFGLELDRLDPFENQYALEVESPGPDRPLFTTRHFERFHDLLVSVRIGDETFRGTIRAVVGSRVTFNIDGLLRDVQVHEIDSARLAQWPESPR